MFLLEELLGKSDLHPITRKTGARWGPRGLVHLCLRREASKKQARETADECLDVLSSGDQRDPLTLLLRLWDRQQSPAPDGRPFFLKAAAVFFQQLSLRRIIHQNQVLFGVDPD